MGYFVAYRFTGADPSHLEELIPHILSSFKTCGHEAYCTYFEEEKFKKNGLTTQQIFEHAFSKIEELGKLFVVIDSQEKSEGQLIEIGYCLAKAIPIYVAKNKSVGNTYIEKLSDKFFTYETLEDLRAGIQQMCEE